MCEECDAHLKAARKEAREAKAQEEATESAVQESDTSILNTGADSEQSSAQ